MSIADDRDYGITQIMFLEAIWGEGFLSPGGTKEIDLVLENIKAERKTILDIGMLVSWENCSRHP